MSDVVLIYTFPDWVDPAERPISDTKLPVVEGDVPVPRNWEKVAFGEDLGGTYRVTGVTHDQPSGDPITHLDVPHVIVEVQPLSEEEEE